MSECADYLDFKQKLTEVSEKFTLINQKTMEKTKNEKTKN